MENMEYQNVKAATVTRINMISNVNFKFSIPTNKAFLRVCFRGFSYLAISGKA